MESTSAFEGSFYEAKFNIKQIPPVFNIDFSLHGHPKLPPPPPPPKEPPKEPPKRPKKGVHGQFKMSLNTLGASTYEWSLDLTQFHLSSETVNGGCTLDYIKSNGLKCERKYNYYFLNITFIR